MNLHSLCEKCQVALHIERCTIWLKTGKQLIFRWKHTDIHNWPQLLLRQGSEYLIMNGMINWRLLPDLKFTEVKFTRCEYENGVCLQAYDAWGWLCRRQTQTYKQAAMWLLISEMKVTSLVLQHIKTVHFVKYPFICCKCKEDITFTVCDIQ